MVGIVSLQADRIQQEYHIAKRYYIVVDFEATCWPDDNRRADVEIIEFGCVKMSQQTARVISEFSTFVRPTRYPKLSQYCTDLTSITQETVDAAPTFPEALANFIDWMGDPRTCTLCSWGAYDKFLLRQACSFNRVPYPFDDEYINIKPAFSEIFSGRGVSMERAMEMLDIKQEGRRHSGIDDARNAAKLWKEVLKNSKF
jgi:inhibitor of KinA sporulation pathway (predicted exonuclease)